VEKPIPSGNAAPIKECTFQPEDRVVRYPTDVIGDPLVAGHMEKNRAVKKTVKLM